VLSALSFNWLSALWSPTAPVVMLFVLASLGLLLISDSDKLKNLPALGWINSIKRHGLVKLCLVALTLGFAIGYVTLFPIWPTVSYPIEVPMEIPFLPSRLSAHNYEVGALAGVVLMVTLAGYRAPDLRKQAVFLVSAVYGVAVAINYLRPAENDFLQTLVGSFLISAVAVAVLVTIPHMFLTLKEFWAIDSSHRR
jgi:hypothetical protein